MDKPATLIIRTAGINCDRELAYAFEQAGSQVQVIHLNRLLKEPSLLESFDLIGLPGGFSYGDDISAGRIFANRLRHHLFEPLVAAIDRGVPVIGICNGFQVLVKLGLLPDPHEGLQRATLTDNLNPRFVDKWVSLEVDPSSPCVWTQGITGLELPIAHGEGRFFVDDATLASLLERNQVAIRYTNGTNPNGSVDDIAGICDASGLVFGLMPHPERFVTMTQHPGWVRGFGDGEDYRDQVAPGLRIFQNAVEHVRNRMAAGTETGVG